MNSFEKYEAYKEVAKNMENLSIGTIIEKLNWVSNTEGASRIVLVNDTNIGNLSGYCRLVVDDLNCIINMKEDDISVDLLRSTVNSDMSIYWKLPVGFSTGSDSAFIAFPSERGKKCKIWDQDIYEFDQDAPDWAKSSISSVGILMKQVKEYLDGNV